MDDTRQSHPGSDFVIAGATHRPAHDGMLEDTTISAWRERIGGALAATRGTSLTAEASAHLAEAEAALAELFHTLLAPSGPAHLKRGWERMVRVPVAGTVS